jgi:hypothetical protein
MPRLEPSWSRAPSPARLAFFETSQFEAEAQPMVTFRTIVIATFALALMGSSCAHCSPPSYKNLRFAGGEAIGEKQADEDWGRARRQSSSISDTLAIMQVAVSCRSLHLLGSSESSQSGDCTAGGWWDGNITDADEAIGYACRVEALASAVQPDSPPAAASPAPRPAIIFAPEKRPNSQLPPHQVAPKRIPPKVAKRVPGELIRKPRTKKVAKPPVDPDWKHDLW